MFDETQLPTRESYSVGYDVAACEFFSRRRARTHAGFFLPYLRPGIRLLDIGCGPGSITIDLAQCLAPGEVVGVDIEPTQIERARQLAAQKQVTNVRFNVADTYALPNADCSFDAVLMHGVLEHRRDPERALREVLRVLRPNGVLGARHADFGGFLIEPAVAPLDQFASLFSQLMRHNGSDPHAGRHQLQWLRAAGFDRVAVSASYDCWTSSADETRETSRFLHSLFSDSDFARQLISAGLANTDLLTQFHTAINDWTNNADAFAAEAWTEVIAKRPERDPATEPGLASIRSTG